MAQSKPFDVRMKGFKDRCDVADMHRLIASRLSPLPDETCSIFQAAGRSLARPVQSKVSVPGFERAAMDGYALRADETFGASSYNEIEFTVLGQSMPGTPFDGQVSAGQAVRIMTGAPVPKGATAVLMAEYAREENDRVYVSEAIAPGKNIGKIGEDIKAGDTILSLPRRLRPQDLAVCAATGIDRLVVHRQPSVQIIVTGNELLPAGSKPSGCQIVDTNSVMLRALIERDGGKVVDAKDGPIRILADDRETIRNALLNSAADCMLISGGSSVGKEDHAPTLIAELGELSLHGVALRPASPAGVGFIGSKPVFLMPGNPVSCLCAYDLFAGRGIRILAGRSPNWNYPAVQAPLRRRISSVAGRVDYCRVRFTETGHVEPLAVSGASILSSTTRADGFVLVPKDLEGYAENTPVTVWCYDSVTSQFQTTDDEGT